MGYKYAHDFPKHWVDQQYLPDALVGQTFYEPSENGSEEKIKKWMEYLKNNEE